MIGAEIQMADLADIDTLTCPRFAQHLYQLVDDGEFAAITARPVQFSFGEIFTYV